VLEHRSRPTSALSDRPVVTPSISNGDQDVEMVDSIDLEETKSEDERDQRDTGYNDASSDEEYGPLLRRRRPTWMEVRCKSRRLDGEVVGWTD
jgi:hypothetical protein